jgi:hypothetical protein
MQIAAAMPQSPEWQHTCRGPWNLWPHTGVHTKDNRVHFDASMPPLFLSVQCVDYFSLEWMMSRLSVQRFLFWMYKE